MSKKFNQAFLILVFLFLYIPILVLIMYSFNDTRNQYHFTGFTLHWYTDILNNTILLEAMKTTILVAIFSTAISVIIGFIASVGIMFLKSKYRKVFLSVNNIPIINPDIVTGISLMVLFITFRYSLGFSSMLLAHITFSIPFVILAVLPKLNDVGIEVIQSALDLGLKPFQVIYKVILPICKTSLITGALMAFTMSIDDFVISYFTTGNGVNNLSIWIFSQTKKGVNPSANAVSTILFLIVLILLLIMFRRQSKNQEEFYEIG